MTTIEFSAPSYERALAHFADSGIADRITAIFGDARRVIADLPAES